MYKPQASIILAITTESPFILATLKSIRKQSFKNIEILVGNTARSVHVSHLLHSYAKRRRYIRIIPVAKGKDMLSTFNTLVSKARGTFISRVDVGSILVNTRIEKQIAYLQEHTETVAIGGQQRPYKKYARVHTKYLPLNHDDIYALSFLSLAINPSTITVNTKKLPKSFRWYNQSLQHIQEFDLLFHLMSYGKLANLSDIVSRTHSTESPLNIQTVKNWLLCSIQTIYHAITKYGLSPHGKTLTQSTIRLFR